MLGDEVAQVRRFNRTVTQRVGALDDHYLARARPLGEARLLWEIGEDGCDVRALRARIELDSGYVSRLLRSREAAGLVAVEPGAGDRRVRTVRLTEAGRAERELLDRGSDELAASFLAPLSPSQRQRLVAAMGEVERLLTAAMVDIGPVDPEHLHARHCMGEYAAELDRRLDGGFDEARSRPVDPEGLRPPRGVVLVATLHGEPIGCGSLRFKDGEPTEIKRLWVAPEARGLGVARRILGELEATAAARHPVVRLDTNGALTEAIALYRSSGYQEVEPFNDEAYAHHWFAKRVGDQPPSSSGTTTT
jgi:DNA-binding MarR family transcriptional regulator/GNAT superfamily N-acetyltransferase